MVDKKECQDCFNMHDKDGSQRISVKMLGAAVRALGFNPTNEKMDQIARANINGSTFTVDDLLRVANKLASEPGFGEEEIREAFRVFDRDGNGMVSAAELRHVMTNLGEKLTDEEVDEMIQAVEVAQDGTVNYEEWVPMMVSPPNRR